MASLKLDLRDGVPYAAYNNPIYDTIQGEPKPEKPPLIDDDEGHTPKSTDDPAVIIPTTESPTHASSAATTNDNNNVQSRFDPIAVTPALTEGYPTQPRKTKPTKRRDMMLHYFAMFFLCLFLSFGVSLLVVFLFPVYGDPDEYFAAAIHNTDSTRDSARDCAVANGGCDGQCMKTPQGHRCVCGGSRFQLGADNVSCIDINECNRNPCGSGYTCLNTHGSHQCIMLQTNPSGSTYVRWGRTSCPERIDTELVYTGYAGGQHYVDKGGSSSYLCLPKEPEWGNYNMVPTNETKKRNYISGTEYEKEDLIMEPFLDTHASILDDHDAPCAVCRTNYRSTVRMFAARRQCYPGWTLEYGGYLMSDTFTDARSRFVCVDQAPEVLNGSHINLDGAGFFLVLGQCGTLPCLPYNNQRELVCAVCSK